ncbi:MAG: hypothetical protein DRI89_05720 [Bacteroidetes bacterium]|nr:MAG: hypothetical protein DRI89_05720 [Bacteroidota bacterium]
MKKIYLIAFSFLFIISGFAQNNPFKMDKAKMRVETISSSDNQTESKQVVKPLPEMPIPGRDVNFVSIIDIGTSANAYSYWKKLSYLWVDQDLNTVVNIHRMGGVLDPGGFSGDLGYDISKNGGTTWDNMIEFYVAIANPEEWLLSSARYPQGGIFNPAGNTEPDDAYLTYFTPCLYDMPPPWTHVHGVSDLGDTTYNTSIFLFSNDRFHQYIPSGFDINTEGKVFVIDDNENWTNDSLDYRDSLIIYKGVWSEEIEDFIYEREMLEALVDSSCRKPFDTKVAFGLDGQTGYIVMIANNGEAEQVEGFQNLYPIYWKTTDGGEVWSGPEVIQIDGPSGMNGIVNHHLTDEQIFELFGSNPPPRTEISYTTAFDCDIAVDDNGRLHIAVVIGPTGLDPYSIITAEGYLAAYDLFLENPYNPFCAVPMGRIRTFRGYIGEAMTYDNRIQITTNPTLDKIFISWLDTDLEDEEENNRPNIWVRGFDVHTFQRTSGSLLEDGPTNVTLFSEGMWQAHLFAAPKTAFESDGEITIPYVFVELDTADPNPDLAPIQFKYIQDFSFGNGDWCWEYCGEIHCGWVGQEEINQVEEGVIVSGNVPNPFRTKTNIQIELYQSENVTVTVYSITGQHLFDKDFGRLNQGSHELLLQLNGLSSGVYFYTVAAGQNRVAKKMVVE